MAFQAPMPASVNADADTGSKQGSDIYIFL